MTRILENRLHRLSAPDAVGLLRGGLRGVERECLRVNRDGHVSRAGHPLALGSALTNRYITTDYSEALLEFVTPPVGTNWETLQLLFDIHQFATANIGAELLWPLSMPCRLRSEADIPLARYGTSNIGTLKHIYRRGLGYRYGRYMQAIAGIHYNYSPPEGFWPLYQQVLGDSGDLVEFRSRCYLGGVRNVRRLDWILLYLFGASPAVCASFLQGRDTAGLEEFSRGTMYGRHATSLRMSDLGYRNSAQADLQISANSLDEYVADLVRATHTHRPEFERIGVKVDGRYRQLSASQLQIENEFYSTIRPKRVAESGERATAALLRGGVQYLELRALDISPADPVGINQRELRFLETFLLYCLLLESPALDAAGQERIDHNHGLVARRGRDPALRLRRDDGDVSLRDWASEICNAMVSVAGQLDPDEKLGHVDAVRSQLALVREPELTPSAQLLAALEQSGASLADYGLDLARRNREYFLSIAPQLNTHLAVLEDEARRSLEEQQRIEASDDLYFDDFLERYLR